MQQSHNNSGDNRGVICNIQQFHNNPVYMQQSINTPSTLEVSTVLHNVISGNVLQAYVNVAAIQSDECTYT